MSYDMYSSAQEMYAREGVDTEEVLSRMDRISISMHCWQGDDVNGFERGAGALSGGIMSTGNYPGRARSAEELMHDAAFAMSLIPGTQRFSLHANYPVCDTPVERNALEPEHFAAWVAWAKELGIALDFNSTFFAHPKSSEGTLSSADEATRRYWVEHAICCKRIAEYFGRELKSRAMHNIWIPDGSKEMPVDTLSPRERLLRSLGEIQSVHTDSAFELDSVESKLFGIGMESYTVGSHEFYLAYAATHKDVALTLDTGHFHPTETVSAKLSSVLMFVLRLVLHISRPVRWDSDHVVILDDELAQVMLEVNRLNAWDRVSIALDYFDASINRTAAWVIGVRNAQKAILRALLEPVGKLREAEYAADRTLRLALLEEQKSMPWQAVWDKYCAMHNVPERSDWVEEIKLYEKNVLSLR